MRFCTASRQACTAASPVRVAPAGAGSSSEGKPRNSTVPTLGEHGEVKREVAALRCPPTQPRPLPSVGRPPPREAAAAAARHPPAWPTAKARSASTRTGCMPPAHQRAAHRSSLMKSKWPASTRTRTFSSRCMRSSCASDGRTERGGRQAGWQARLSAGCVCAWATLSSAKKQRRKPGPGNFGPKQSAESRIADLQRVALRGLG